MKRTEIKSLMKGELLGSKVKVMGWVRTFRSKRFIAINDGSTIKNMQVVVDFEGLDESLLKRITTGAAVSVEGELVESQGAGQDYEVVAESVEVLGEAHPDEYPLQPKKHTLEYLREIAHLRPRTNTFSAILRVRHALAFAIHKYFNDNGYYYLHAPIITGSDAEGAGDMFRVTSIDPIRPPLKNDYLDQFAERYYSNISELSKSINPKKEKSINSMLKTIDESYSLKRIVTASFDELREINASIPPFDLVRIELNDLYNSIELDLFQRIKPKGKKVPKWYIPNWLFIALKQPSNTLRLSKRYVRLMRKFLLYPRRHGGIYGLNFYNLYWVDRFQRLSSESSIDWKRDFFGKKTNLTVSGQLEAELGALALSKVYTFGPTFRAENSNTSRHLAEFWMIEPEVAFAELDDNMDLAEDCLKYVIKYTLDHCEDDLAFLSNRRDQEEKSLPQDKRSPMPLMDQLKLVLENDFERVTYTEAIDILRNSKPNKKKKFQYPVNDWGVDLQSEHERYLVEKHFEKPVILYNYPKEIKAFYMRQNDDDKTVAAMDILFPGIGEIVGGSQREERLDMLKQKLTEFDIPEEEMWWYLDTRKFGTVRHSGFGLGFERLVLFVTGMGNVRDVIPFPRTPKNAEF